MQHGHGVSCTYTNEQINYPLEDQYRGPPPSLTGIENNRTTQLSSDLKT
jgi:hypothetical protein